MNKYGTSSDKISVILNEVKNQAGSRVNSAKNLTRDASGFALSMILLLAVLLFDPHLVFAQLPSVLNPIATPPEAGRIGVVAAVKGQVEITDSRAVGRVVESGAPIYLGDTVSTDEKGQLQILLKDETVFTIGPNSSIVIDRFVYDPATQDGEVTAQILKGTFRFITGKIARKKPENMNVKLPVGSIGVRGTIVAGQVEGDQSMAVLLGPGPNNQIGEPPGSFVLNNTVNNQVMSTHVTQINFGSEIGGVNQAPVGAYRVPDSVIANITDTFSAPSAAPTGAPPTPGGPGTPAGPGIHPTGPSPDAMMGALQNLGGIAITNLAQFVEMGLLDFSQFDSILSLIAQDISFRDLQALAPDNATTFEELRSLNDGAFHYENYGVPTTRSGVTFNIEANINTSTDVFGGAAGTGSKITQATTDIGNFDFPLASNCSTCNYNPTAFTGPAGFFYSGIANSVGGACATCTADVSIGLGNINTDVGAGAGISNLAVVGVLLDVTIKNSSGTVLAQQATHTIAERISGTADGSNN